MTSPNLLQPRARLTPDFGSLLRDARKKRRWSQARLAERAGVSRETIARVETGRIKPGLHLVRTLLRQEVLGTELKDIEGWERFDEPDHSVLGFRAYAARIASRRTLTDVAAVTGTSAASLSHFERGLAGPKAIVGPGSDRGEGIASDAYAQALGFADAADMTEYVHADDPLPWLEAIAERFDQELPPVARMPTRRGREPEVELDDLSRDLLASQ